MANPYSLLSSKLYIFVFFELFVTKSNMTIEASSSVILKLIHSDILSPYVTVAEHFRRIEDSSMARYNYLKMINIQISKNDDKQSSLVPDKYGSTFYINFSIGEPPVSQIALIDTGSQLLWIPCYPCTNCSSPIIPTYDPSKSSTYLDISCDSKYCNSLHCCSTNRTCCYKVDYADNSNTRGELGMEELKFSTIDDGITSISNLVFGCGHENHGAGFENGVLGLSAGSLSLVSQLGSKFLYCIGSIHDPKYEYNNLVIGESAKLEGYSTPMKTYNGLYYLTLEGISVGDKKLDIDRRIFQKEWNKNKGVIIDSGTTLIYLARSAYYPLVEEVQCLIGGLLQKVIVWSNKEKLCYKGRASEELKGFPVVTFHFAGEADLVVEEGSMFVQYPDDIFCLQVNSVADSELNVIGITAQQYYNIGYDIEEMALYFQRIDCELLEE